jgi:hypothetical protein
MQLCTPHFAAGASRLAFYMVRERAWAPCNSIWVGDNLDKLLVADLHLVLEALAWWVYNASALLNSTIILTLILW